MSTGDTNKRRNNVHRESIVSLVHGPRRPLRRISAAAVPNAYRRQAGGPLGPPHRSKAPRVRQPRPVTRPRTPLMVPAAAGPCPCRGPRAKKKKQAALPSAGRKNASCVPGRWVECRRSANGCRGHGRWRAAGGCRVPWRASPRRPRSKRHEAAAASVHWVWVWAWWRFGCVVLVGFLFYFICSRAWCALRERV